MLDEARVLLTRMGTFGGHSRACQDLAAVDILDVMRCGAAAMRPPATSYCSTEFGLLPTIVVTCNQVE